jgi:putative tricarboxylic transport membrane protein
MNRIAKFIGPLIIIVVLCLMFRESMSYEARDSLWPQGLMIGIFLLCLKYLYDRIREAKPEKDCPRDASSAKYMIWGTVILTVGYLFVCNWAGYYISTAVFMAAVLLALGERSWIILSVLPVATTFVIYAVFFLFLRIPLPTGIFF